jgi:hypothetical protein
LRIGYRHERAVLGGLLEHFPGTWVIVDRSQHILKLHRLAVDERPAHDEVAGGWTRKKAVERLRLLGRKVVEGYQVQKPIREPRDSAEVRLTQLRCTGDHGLEHRLNLRG